LAIPVSISAHHSWQLDRARLLTLRGTVTSFAFANPHVQIYFDVKDDQGNVENWTAGGPSPNRLARSGWTRDTLKPGDEITAVGYRNRNGSNVLRFDHVTMANGQVIGGYRNR
jgi:hypothetical protein